MRISKRLLLVVVAVVAAVVAYTPSSQAATSPVITMVVPCDDADGVNSGDEYGLEVAPGLYSVTVVGACSFRGSVARSVTVTTPCSTTLGTTPCATTTVSNIPGEACGTALGILEVELCEPVGSTIDTTVPPPPTCSHTVKVNDTCLANGWSQIMSLPSGGVTAVYVDTGHSDNIGYFVVTIRPAV